MPQLSLKERLSALEQEVAQLKLQQANGRQHKPWLRTMGMFAGDEGLKDIFREAMKLRDRDRQRAYRRFDRKTSAPKANT